MKPVPLPAEDLQHIEQHMGARWEALRGRDLLITGGTGFFGKWLLESFVAANSAHALGARAWVVSRNPDAFYAQMPHLLGERCLEFIAGDVQSFAVGKTQRFSHVIHGATSVSNVLRHEAPLQLLDSIVLGTRHVLELAHTHGAESVLLTSSGAVYGTQPLDIDHVSETSRGGPDPTDFLSAYGEGKRLSENLCAVFGRSHQLSCKIARCFALVGPHLPLDDVFAAGNFLRDAHRGGPVQVGGDGTPLRSYLYAADLAIWLWRILLEGAPSTAYNVGSEHAVSIIDLARRVAGLYGCDVTVAKTPPPEGTAPPRYVPSTARAQETLQLRAWVDLDEALRRSKRYLQSALGPC